MRTLMIIAASLAVSTTSWASSPAQEAHTEIQRYVRVVDSVTFIDLGGVGQSLLCDSAGTEVHVGGACFAVRDGDRTVHLDLEDDVQSLSSEVEVWLLDANGFVLEVHVLCGDGTFTVEQGTTQMRVHLVDHLLDPIGAHCTATAPPTTGTIAAHFSPAG